MDDTELLRSAQRAYDIVFKSAVEFSCIKACYELNLFDVMKQEPMTLDALANVLEAVPPRLERFLITLMQIGLVEQQHNEWSLTPLARQFFVADDSTTNLSMVPHIEYMANFADNFFMKLSQAVRGKVDLSSVVPYPPTTPEESFYYENIHRSNVYFPIKLILEHGVFDGVKHMLDVGGGIGDIAAAICDKYPEISVSLVNLPSALDLVRDNAVAKGVGDRITPISIDMYRDPYPPCDAVLFGRILYPLNAQFSTMMCQNAFKGLNPGGRIFILDMNISDPDAPNYDYLTHYMCAIGLQFSVLDFKSHTIYPDILRSVGFEEVTCTEAYDHVLYQAIKPRA